MHITLSQVVVCEALDRRFFGASTACAAFVNNVSDDIAQQMAERLASASSFLPLEEIWIQRYMLILVAAVAARFGSDIGLVVGLLKDVRTVGMRSSGLGKHKANLSSSKRVDSHPSRCPEAGPHLCANHLRNAAGAPKSVDIEQVSSR